MVSSLSHAHSLILSLRFAAIHWSASLTRDMNEYNDLAWNSYLAAKCWYNISFSANWRVGRQIPRRRPIIIALLH